MNVELVDFMGDDLMVVNSARVSFDKESNFEIEGDMLGEYKFILPEGDIRLIKYLAKHGHWTPFAHPQITLRVTAPVFVRTQLFKHKVGFTENEVSRRYVDNPPSFFSPISWRGKPVGSVKQGSSDVSVTWDDSVYTASLEACYNCYLDMLEAGIAPEQARMVLPQSMYTEWYWTGSLAAYGRMCRQRLDAHAQSETREIAQMISDIIQPLFPISWEALTK
jgi:thymidylate synthase (FAD)